MNNDDKGGKTSPHVIASTARKQVTGHWKGTEAITPELQRSRSQTEYLTTTRFNLQHTDERQFASRAHSFNIYQPAEKNLLDSVNRRMQNTQQNRENPSKEVMQSGWMLHAQRGMIGKSEQLQRAKIPDSSPEARQLVDMFQKGVQGPLTFQQSQLGAEVAVTSVFMQDKETQRGIKQHRVSSQRDPDLVDPQKASHQTQSRFGMGLNSDLGTQVREAMGLPIMSGTSGTSSLMALSHRHAAKETGMHESDPTQGSNSETTRSMANLSLQYMRQGVVPQSVDRKTTMNLTRQHSGTDLISRPTDSSRIQTHTYPEIYSAVDMTRRGQSGQDAQHHVDSNKRAQSILIPHLPQPKAKL